ncbi:hypothetical protein [Rubripirellula amarantea]|nr:hypothetical protein [Rubripirellula amarantea]
MMASLVAIMASTAAVDISRGFVEGIAEARMATEFRVLSQSLRRDFAGSLPESRSGHPKRWRLVGKQLVSDTELQLCFDSQLDGTANWSGSDRIITYLLDTDTKRFIRNDSVSGNDFVMAENVSDMEILIDSGVISLWFEFSVGDWQREFRFATSDLP